MFSTLEDNWKIYGLCFGVMIPLNQMGEKHGNRSQKESVSGLGEEERGKIWNPCE